MPGDSRDCVTVQGIVGSILCSRGGRDLLDFFFVILFWLAGDLASTCLTQLQIAIANWDLVRHVLAVLPGAAAWTGLPA